MEVNVDRTGTTSDGYVLDGGQEEFHADGNGVAAQLNDEWHRSDGSSFLASGRFVVDGDTGEVLVDEFSLTCADDQARNCWDFSRLFGFVSVSWSDVWASRSSFEVIRRASRTRRGPYVQPRALALMADFEVGSVRYPTTTSIESSVSSEVRDSR